MVLQSIFGALFAEQFHVSMKLSSVMGFPGRIVVAIVKQWWFFRLTTSYRTQCILNDFHVDIVEAGARHTQNKDNRKRETAAGVADDGDVDENDGDDTTSEEGVAL